MLLSYFYLMKSREQQIVRYLISVLITIGNPPLICKFTYSQLNMKWPRTKRIEWLEYKNKSNFSASNSWKGWVWSETIMCTIPIWAVLVLICMLKHPISFETPWGFKYAIHQVFDDKTHKRQGPYLMISKIMIFQRRQKMSET